MKRRNKKIFLGNFSSSKQCTVVNARETAPASANETMYNDSPEDALIGHKLFSYRKTKQISRLRYVRNNNI